MMAFGKGKMSLKIQKESALKFSGKSGVNAPGKKRKTGGRGFH
jgi:hypothetical protein